MTKLIYSGITQPQQICQVSYDFATGKNMIVWEPNHTSRIQSFQIIRDGLSIASIDPESIGMFIDSTSNPFQQPYSYSIKLIDSCGNEATSSEVSSIFVHTNADSSSSYITWEGPTAQSNWIVFRVTVTDSTFNVDTVTVVGSSYHSCFINGAFPGAQYVVALETPSCNPNRSATQPWSFSNIYSYNVTGISKLSNEKATIYPNPSNGTFTIEGASGNAKIYNELGQEVLNRSLTKRETLNINTSGIYLVKFENTGETQRLVIK